MAARRVSSSAYYREYHGHLVEHLESVHAALSGVPASSDPAATCVRTPLVFLAGDSSLDNKYWCTGGRAQPALNGMERVLDPPVSVPDVAHALNAACAAARLPLAAVNAAVEEATVCGRARALRPQDRFIAQHLSSSDGLVVSVGGNDIVLRPSLSTIINIATLLAFASDASIDAGTAWGFAHFVDIFRNQVQAYVTAMCARTAPKIVVVCMVYFPQEAAPGGDSSWADGPLAMMGYKCV